MFSMKLGFCYGVMARSTSLLLYLVACIAFACVLPYLFKQIDKGFNRVQTTICPCKK